MRVEDRRQRPPRLHDLPSLQKLCSARFGWSASKTLDVAQELYDGTGKKILTYPRAEVRYLPESAIADVPRIVAGLRAGKSYAAIPAPSPPAIRKGRDGAFHDKGLEGESHPNPACAGHAVAIVRGGGCFQYHIGRTGSPSFKVVEWPDGGDASQEEPACGAHYHSYGPVELSYVTTMISDVARVRYITASN